MKKILDEIRFNKVHFPLDLNVYKISGVDAESFLHAQTTQNIKSLKNKEWKWATFLERSGKIESYFWILKESHNEYFILAPLFFTKIIFKRFDQYVISEDVILEDQGVKKISISLGPKSDKTLGYFGYGIEELSVISFDDIRENEVSNEIIDSWWRISGLPQIKLLNFHPVLLNNSRLIDLALDPKKGCYPGQETVAKISTNRGASYFPALLEISKPTHLNFPQDIFIEEKKVATLNGLLSLEDKCFFEADILRDYRVDNLKINFSLNNSPVEAVVRYFPYFKLDIKAKAYELYINAIQTYQNNQAENALLLLDQSLAFNPDSPDSYEVYGVILTHLNRLDEAKKMMEKLLTIHPQSVMAHTNLSLILMKQGKIEEAETHKSLATVATFAQFGQEAKNKSTIEENNKKAQEELLKREKMFQEVLSIDPDDPMALYGVGEIFFERNDYQNAQSYLEKVILNDPGYSVAYLLLSKIYSKLSLFDKLKETLVKGIKISAQKGAMMPANEMQGMLNRLN